MRSGSSCFVFWLHYIFIVFSNNVLGNLCEKCRHKWSWECDGKFPTSPPVPHHLSNHHKAFTKTEMHFISNYFLVFFTYSLTVLLLHPLPFCPRLTPGTAANISLRSAMLPWFPVICSLMFGWTASLRFCLPEDNNRPVEWYWKEWLHLSGVPSRSASVQPLHYQAR